MAVFKRIKDPVLGEGRVLRLDTPYQRGRSMSCRFWLELNAPGIDGERVDVKSSMPSRKWPDIGQVLPVTIDRSDPTRVDIRWAEVPDVVDIAWQLATAIADGVNAGEVESLPAYPAAAQEIIRRYPGLAPGGPIEVDLPADVAGLGDLRTLLQSEAVPAAPLVAPTTATPSLASGSASDGERRLKALETLADLRDQGVFTPQQFENEKRMLLGEA